MMARAPSSSTPSSSEALPRPVHGREVNSRPAVARIAALGAAAALILTACGAGEQEPEAQGDTSPRAGSERLLATAEAGMERASSFGFGSAGFATEEAVEQVRDQAQETMAEGGDYQVTPVECAEPIAAVDFSPIMLDSDAARVDFGSETFTGTGSIEIATIPDAEAQQRVTEHMDNVTELVESCGEVDVTMQDTEYHFRISPVELNQLSDENTVAYTRTQSLGHDSEGDEDDGTIAAQILFTQAGDDVVMVSFLGEPAAGSEEFTEIAEALTEETLAGL